MKLISRNIKKLFIMITTLPPRYKLLPEIRILSLGYTNNRRKTDDTQGIFWLPSAEREGGGGGGRQSFFHFIFIISPFGKYLTHLQLCGDFSFHFFISFTAETPLQTAVVTDSPIVGVWSLHIYAQPHFKSNKFCSFALKLRKQNEQQKNL